MASAKQRAAQNRLAKAAKAAKRKGLKGQAFRNFVAKQTKGKGGGGGGSSGGGGGDSSGGGSSGSKAPKIGRTYQGTRLTVLALAAAFEEGLETVGGKDPRQALNDLRAKAFTGPHGKHLLVLALESALDKSRLTGQAAAISRGSVTAAAPEILVALEVALEARDRRLNVRDTQRLYTGRVTGYDPGNNTFDAKRMTRYRAVKHGGQLARFLANRTRLGQRITRPLKEAGRMLGVTI